MQLNHLLLLSAETILSANIALGALGLLVRSIYILTPLILLTQFDSEKLTDSEANFLRQFNGLYYTSIAVNIVATCALGNPLFALASLSMMALNAYGSGEVARVFTSAKKIAAICAFIGYGAEVFAAPGFIGALAKVSTIAMGVKLCMINSQYLTDKFHAGVKEIGDYFTPSPKVTIKSPKLISVEKAPSQNIFYSTYNGFKSRTVKVANFVKGVVLWPLRVEQILIDLIQADPIHIAQNRSMFLFTLSNR
jgi:hypothetical protein